MKKLFLILLVIAMMFTVACSSDNNSDDNGGSANDIITSASDGSIEHTEVVFDVENIGSFTVETYPEHAPETVAHFLELVKSGYYNGISVEKINPGHSVVISDKTTLSSGECKETVTGEFYDNGYSNDLSITKGTLAFCYLPGEYDSACAKFMIVLGDELGLDGSYGGFAKITEGMSVLDKLVANAINADNTPGSPIVMKKVYVKE